MPPPSDHLVVRVVTFAILIAALFILLVPGYDAAARTWATSAMAGLTGYWLRSSARKAG